MTSEQRLSEALRAMDDYEPSRDLWTRVLYSIEEDREHRRRLWRFTLGVAVMLGVVVGAGFLAVSTVPGTDWQVIDWRVLEILSSVALVTVVLALGPALRRFGRGYVGELFVTSRGTGDHLMRLLDIAYYLVFASYVLVTVRLEVPQSFAAGQMGEQINDVLRRAAGLLLTMGLLHALTFVALPVVALVFNSTRAGTRLPRWVSVLLVLGGIIAFVLTPLFVIGPMG